MSTNTGQSTARAGRRANGTDAPTARRAWLLVSTPGQPTVRVEIHGQPVRIGRATDSGIVLADQFVSGRHAEVLLHGGTQVVRDLGSSNGTRLNGRPLAPGVLHPLQDGDTLQLGDSQLTYHGGTGLPAAAAPVPVQAPTPTPVPAPSPAPPAARPGIGHRLGHRFGRVLGRALLRLIAVVVLLAVLAGGALWLLAPTRVVVLVLGSDARPDELQRGAAGRTDTLLAVAADRQLDGLTMISIPRDLWVPIPGHGEERINTAYALGGARTAEQAASDVLGVPINRSVVIGLQGVRDVVDAAGGIEIDVPHAIHDDAYPTDDYGTMVLDIPAGRQWMDGETALRYARTRHQDSDFGRMDRQQQVIAALRSHLLQPSSWRRWPAVFQAARQATQTNLGLLDLATLGLVAGRGDAAERLTLDLTLVEELRGHDGAYLLRPRAALKQRVGVVLGPASAGVEVLNGGQAAGAAGRAGETLRARGLRVVNVGDAPRPQPTTTVEVCGGCRRAGLLVADALGLPADAVHESLVLPTGVDVQVTLGPASR